MTKAEDWEYEDSVITKVTPGDGGWEISHNSLCFWIPSQFGVEPKVDQVARFYGRGLGSVVRGVDLDGVEVFYRTPEQQDAENKRLSEAWHQEKREAFEAKGRAVLDAQYDALPAVFQQRIDRFRRNKPDFRWENEGYEMSCCVDAVKISAACPTVDDVRAFHDLSWTAQKAKVPDLFEGHSGNSFGMACRLAALYVENAKLVPLDHGALCVLTGCQDYGCAPLPSPEEYAAARA